MWKIVTDKTQEHWLQVEDGEGWWSAFVKWDGCLEVTRFFNKPGGDGRNDSSIHICDLDDFIRRLESLRESAREHFGPDWPK